MALPKEEPRDPALARYVYERLAAIIPSVETAAAVAKRCGVAESSLSNILRGGGEYGVGRRLCTKLLPVLRHRTYGDLLASAHAKYGAHVPSYPSLATILERHQSAWSEAAVSAVRQLRPPTDPGAEYWQRALDGFDALAQAFEAVTPRGEDPLAAIEKRSKKK